MSQPVRAAGGIVLRGEEGDRSVALVHRPRYGDWSFPKGKLEDVVSISFTNQLIE